MFFTKKGGQRYQLQGYLRRICDLTSPNMPRLDDSRNQHRQNRTIPVLLVPWEDGAIVVSDAATALTRDISDNGLSVTLLHPFRAENIVVCFWLPRGETSDPWFFLGTTRQNVPIGGGFWSLGIELTEKLELSSESGTARLLPLAAELLPPRAIATAPASALVRT
jgi:hypothetical protein